MRENSTAGRIKKSALAGYAIGSIGTGIFNTVPSLLLLFYMTDTLGLPPLLAATAVLIPKSWAIFTDPIMGAVSDRTRSRWGRRKPWLLLGAVLLSIGFAFLFRTPPFASDYSRFAWVLCNYAICATAYSIFAVPYVSMAAEMSHDAADRTVIMSWRMSLVIVGVLIGSAVAPALVQAFGGGRKGYGAMSLVMGAVTLAAMLVVVLKAAPAVSRVALQDRTSLAKELALVIRDPLLQRLGAAFILQNIATSTSSAVLPYVATYLLERDQGFIGGLFLTLIGASLAAIPLWARIAGKIGKRRATMIAALCASTMALGFVFVHPGYPAWLLRVQFALVGVGFSGLQVLPFSMITDVIQHDGLARGGAREGVYSGVWTAIEKLGLALGPMVTAAVLAVGGYQQSQSGHSVQSHHALVAILITVSVIPSLLFGVSALIIARHPLSEAILAKLLKARMSS
jgi:glycoside/pentoside/hexuronide:cation symporter, GPH family